ncbi:MAG TPA: hypothetical protein VES02_17520 [Dermatophilaceae bacterium]|nr:hypothetical protein [Dermatophilaceae bacterium]
MLLRTGIRAVVIAIGTVFVGMLGAMIGIWSLDVTMTVVLRSFLAIALLLVMTRTYRISDRRADDQADRPYQQVLFAAGLAFVLSFAGWGGHPLFGQLLTSVSGLSALLDTVVWMAVAILGVRLGDRARVDATVAPVPYA